MSLLPKRISSLFSCATSAHLAQEPSAKARLQECSFCWCTSSARVTQTHRARAHRCPMPALEMSDSDPDDDQSPSLAIPRKANGLEAVTGLLKTFKLMLNWDFYQCGKLRLSPAWPPGAVRESQPPCTPYSVVQWVPGEPIPLTTADQELQVSWTCFLWVPPAPCSSPQWKTHNDVTGASTGQGGLC